MKTNAGGVDRIARIVFLAASAMGWSPEEKS